jgi:hypothetical protein
MSLAVSRRYCVGIASVCFAGFGTLALAQDCSPIAEAVAFCGDPAVWQPFDAPEGDADATFAGPLDVLSQIFADPPGGNDGVTIDGYLAQIRADGRLPLTGATFEVLGHTVDSVDGQEGRSLLLEIEKEGRTALFLMTVVVLPEQTLRLLTIAPPGPPITPKAEVHVAFISAIRIGSSNG